MKREHLFEQFMDVLRTDPQAAAPPGLDPATAEFARKLVCAEAVPRASDAVKQRIWQQLPHPDTQSRPKQSTNGRTPHHSDLNHLEDKTMNTLVITRPTILPRPPTRVLRLRWAPLAAAVIAAVLFAAFMLPSLLHDNSPSAPAAVYLSQEAANRAIFERYIHEAWNAGNTDVLADLLAADHVCHAPGAPDVTGIDGMAAMIANYRTAFPDWQFAIESLTATDDEVWARLTGTGTHEGPFTTSGGAVVDATGDAVTVEVMLNARFTDGQIAAQWMQSDELGLLVQTGALPTPQQAITEAHNQAAARLALEGYHFGKDRHILQQVYPESFIWQYGSRPGDLKHITRDDDGGHYPERIYDAFDDLDMTIDTMTATGDMVMAKLTVTGQFVRSFPVSWTPTVLTPTGEQETWTWILIWRFEDGQVTEENWVWDWPLMHGK